MAVLLVDKTYPANVREYLLALNRFLLLIRGIHHQDAYA